MTDHKLKKKKKKKNIEDGGNGWKTLRIFIARLLLFSAGVFIIIIIINIFKPFFPEILYKAGIGINLPSDVFLLITASLIIYLSIDYLNNFKLKTFFILLFVNFISGIPRLIFKLQKLDYIE